MTPALLATLAALGYAAYYLTACAVFPFGDCRRCNGTGKKHNPFTGKGYRLCTRCGGTGRRVRVGRRLFEYLRREHQHGNPTSKTPGTGSNPWETR